MELLQGITFLNLSHNHVTKGRLAAQGKNIYHQSSLFSGFLLEDVRHVNLRENTSE